LLTLLCASALSHAGNSGEGRKLYKWTDKQGLIHYGDQIPPEYADQERHVMNARGVEVGHVEAQKTPEQQAAADAKAREEAAQRNRDRNLLSSYASVQEIERLRDQRIALVSDQIKVTSNFLETLEARQKKLRATSMNFRPYSSKPDAPAMPDQIADDLVRTGNDIRAQQENLRRKRAEEATLRKSFTADLERFKQLKGIN
jgi:PAB1-binding protein PBP1